MEWLRITTGPVEVWSSNFFCLNISKNFGKTVFLTHFSPFIYFQVDIKNFITCLSSYKGYVFKHDIYNV